MGTKKKTTEPVRWKNLMAADKRKLLEGVIPASTLAADYGVSTNTIFNWRKKALEEKANTASLDKWAERGREEVRIDEKVEKINQEILKEYAGTFEILAEEEAVYKVLITKLIGNTVTPVFVSQAISEPPEILHDLKYGTARIIWDLEK
jgi:transposase-like protein